VLWHVRHGHKMARTAIPDEKKYRVRLTICLVRGIDDDLIRFFEQIPEGVSKASHVVTALRTGTGDFDEKIIVETSDDDLFAEFGDFEL